MLDSRFSAKIRCKSILLLFRGIIDLGLVGICLGRKSHHYVSEQVFVKTLGELMFDIYSLPYKAKTEFRKLVSDSNAENT